MEEAHSIQNNFDFKTLWQNAGAFFVSFVTVWMKKYDKFGKNGVLFFLISRCILYKAKIAKKAKFAI